MKQGKQILVVDDHFAMLESLRTLLLGADPSYQVVAVPSAEEGFLELGRTPYDLLITDILLPGMSGFELVRRVRRLRPEIPTIMITTAPSASEREEAERLGVIRYMEKPLDTRTFLAAVQSALAGAASEAAPPARATAAPAGVHAGAIVETRLQILRADTGASQVALVSKDGQLVCQLGEGDGQELAQLATIAAASMRNGLELAIELESEGPVMIQYQAGERADLYTANVGANYFVMLLFDVRERRGRIGTIWVFAQRAIRELKEMLPEAPAGQEKSRLTRQVAARHRPAPAPPKKPRLQGREPAPAAAAPASLSRANATTSDLSPKADRAAEAELAEMLARQKANKGDAVDAFWEEALDGDLGRTGSGLSLEEAIARGLLPASFSFAAD